MNKMYAKEQKAPKNENNGDIKHVRRNKIRFFVQHSKESFKTCEMLENKIDAIIENMV